MSETRTFRALLRRPPTWIGIAVGTLVAAAALALFQPWKLWIDTTVDETPPAAAATVDSGQPMVLARGSFVSHEHDTTGSAQILRRPDGTRVLRIEDLDTSNGPLLKVWLSDAPVHPGGDGWRVFDDGRHLDLGPLKGNKGSQNYTIPADADLTGYRSVSIWCARFHVSFGAAALTTT